jgi:hypothetical protein
MKKLKWQPNCPTLWGTLLLDVSSFGVMAFSDLTIVNNGLNVDITADEFDGTITLVGVQVAELDGAANFAFA